MASASDTLVDALNNVSKDDGKPEDSPTPIVTALGDIETPRGRLKRRRVFSHSPPRASSPSRGHDRDSGSRHRHHHRKHHRGSSSRSLQQSSSPSRCGTTKKNRRRSDAEPDHTLRGRARNRSGSRSRSPILEGQDEETSFVRRLRRSQPPSRKRAGDLEPVRFDQDRGDVRRQRSFPNLYGDVGSNAPTIQEV
jgi:hypothetical protein